MGDLIVGLDLGQAVDYTALCVVEVVGDHPLRLHCRHLERYALGTLYPDVVSKVAMFLQMPPFNVRGQSTSLLVDGTGVGRAVVDMFREAGLHPIACLVTGGDTVSHEGGYSRVPKRDLVGATVAPIQDGRLKFAADMPLVQTLVQEMLSFKVKINTNAHDSYGAWREGEHDDLLFALMLCCWYAPRCTASPHMQMRVKGRGGKPMIRSARPWSTK